MRFAPPNFRLLSVWLLRCALIVACAGNGVVPAYVVASELRRTAVVKAIEDASPSVVNIHGRKTVRNETEAAGTEHFRQVNGMGTGIVIDERGYIVTNYHVVEGVNRIQVTLSDKRTTVARLVAHDTKTDLAIIKLDLEKKLPVIKIGTSSDLMTGEPVVAVGNAYGYEHTVTRGIVSALHRTVQVSDDQKYHDLIQTDASINPGNSGGPLLNIDGEMIGINVAVRVGAQGIGFAIPIDEALEVAARLMSAERLDNLSHGVSGKTAATDRSSQFVVRSVRKDSPAEKGGLLTGDVITAVGEKKVARSLDFERAIIGRRAGDDVELAVERGGQPVKVVMTIGGATVTASQGSSADKSWETLGLKLEPMPATEFTRLNTRYRGGLKVSAVRPDSPASAQGIRRGDVLVGMHVWETISPENVAYILNRSDFEQIQPVKFYILRGNETLYGHMNVSAGGQ